MINSQRLRGLIDNHFSSEIANKNYTVKAIEANQLLTHNRFDIAFKLIYLELIEKNPNLAVCYYKKHLEILSLGKFTEPGNPNKNSFSKFIQEFEKIFKSFKQDGFLDEKSLIPLSYDGSIANGAHRLAAAIYLNKKVKVVKLETPIHDYSFLFFKNRGLSSNFLDFAATKFVEYARNIHIALVWPSAVGKEYEIKRIIGNIVYEKRIYLNNFGAHNLITQVYDGEEWLGNISNNFKGARGKLVECFKSKGPLRVFVFQNENFDEVNKIKKQIRDIFKIGKHSIHINDSMNEAIKISKLIFNENGINFLNHGNPSKYAKNYLRINQFKDLLEENSCSSEDAVIDGSTIMALYGFRDSKDLDYLSMKKLIQNDKTISIDNHDSEISFHNQSKINLIYNPELNFYFQGLKFISLKQISKFKECRNEPKDKIDCRLIQSSIEGNFLIKHFEKIKQFFFFESAKFRNRLIMILKFLRIFNLIKFLFKRNKL